MTADSFVQHVLSGFAVFAAIVLVVACVALVVCLAMFMRELWRVSR